ncbi:MAG: Ig-like domain-containing protein [Burkholderiaceae bacterium]
MRKRGAAAALALLPMVAMATGGVAVRFEDDASPFPSNRLTRPDFGNITFRRVNLPKPDCTVRITDCADIDVINTLDGFSTQPRITVPFDGEIDLSSVGSDTVFLLNLGDTLTLQGAGDRVGINQVLWDPASQTLVFEPDALLAEHARYLLVVTNGVRDAQGKPIAVSDFGGEGRSGEWRDHWDHRFFRHRWHKPSMGDTAYRRELMDAVRAVRTPPGTRVAAASLFTTQSVTGDLVKVMRQIKRSHPAKADFLVGQAGERPPGRCLTWPTCRP